jgi:hypothetical protein
LRGTSNPATAQKRLHEGLSNSLTDDERKKFSVQINQVNTPWFLYFLTLDPHPALRKVKCPVLALNCENDLQVPVNENLHEIEAALKNGGNRVHATIRPKSATHPEIASIQLPPSRHHDHYMFHKLNMRTSPFIGYGFHRWMMLR